jgi:ABC-type multidrug transport system ATPase subunit
MGEAAVVIRAEGLRRWSGAREVLRGVSFSVHAGEVVALVGPNLSGKTTLLQLCAGEKAPSEGSLVVAGLIPWDEPEHLRCRVGYAPEDDLSEEHIEVEEYLLFSARLKGIPRGRRTRAIVRACEEAGISGARRASIDALSRGDKRRVMLAQALIGEPRALLLDAPFEGLDARAGYEVAGLIRNAARGRAVLVATNRLPEAASISSRLLVLSRGTLVAAGSPGELAALARHESAREVLRVAAPAGETARGLALALLQLAGVRAVTPEELPDGSFRFTLYATREVRGDAILALVSRRVEVLEAREVEGRLSAAYQALVSGRLQ